MGRYYDVIAGMKYAWSRFRDVNLIKWTIIYDVGILVASLLDVVLFYFVFSYLFGWGFEKYLTLGGNLPVISLIAGLWLVPRFFMAAMRAAELSTVGKAPGIIDWAILSFSKFLVMLFSWYDRKLMAPAAVLIGLSLLGVLLGIGGEAGQALSWIAFGLGILAWMVAVLVSGVRVNFADYMYLRGEGEVAKMPRRSYELVRGQTLEVFLAYLVFEILLIAAIVLAIIAMVLIAVVPCVGIIVDIILGIILIIAISAFSQVFMCDMFRFFADGGRKAAAAPAGRPALKKRAARKRRRKK